MDKERGEVRRRPPLDDLESIRNDVLSFHRGVAEFVKRNGREPAEGSLASVERATFPRPEMIVATWSTANQLIEFGGEHLSAFVTAITEPVATIACWTCVRCMLEPCAIAGWLSDPSIDVRTRVGRMLAHQRKGLEEQRKILAAAKKDVSAVNKRITQVEDNAFSLGYRAIGKDGRDRIIHEMPVATTSVAATLDQEVMFRLLSAVAHGHSFAIDKLSYRRIPDARKSELLGVPIVPMEKGLPRTGPNGLAACAVAALAKPVLNRCRYLGWDEAPLLDVFDRTFTPLSEPPFWRT